MEKKHSKLIVMAVICIFITGNAFAGVTIVDGTGFKNTIEMKTTRLQLKGVSVLRYMIFIKAYAGSFYLPEGSDGSQAFDDIMKRLELEYRVAISADDFARATLQKIKESVNSDVFNRILPKIESLNNLYRNVEPGDRYALVYVPGDGTRLVYNSAPLGMIEGAEFANAVFGIWIGDNPIDKAFRDDLLGKSK